MAAWVWGGSAGIGYKWAQENFCGDAKCPKTGLESGLHNNVNLQKLIELSMGKVMVCKLHIYKHFLKISHSGGVELLFLHVILPNFAFYILRFFY